MVLNSSIDIIRDRVYFENIQSIVKIIFFIVKQTRIVLKNLDSERSEEHKGFTAMFNFSVRRQLFCRKNPSDLPNMTDFR